MVLGFIHLLLWLFPECKRGDKVLCAASWVVALFFPPPSHSCLFALTTISGLDNIIIVAEEARVINSWRLPTAGSQSGCRGKG